MSRLFVQVTVQHPKPATVQAGHHWFNHDLQHPAIANGALAESILADAYAQRPTTPLDHLLCAGAIHLGLAELGVGGGWCRCIRYGCPCRWRAWSGRFGFREFSQFSSEKSLRPELAKHALQ